MDRAVLLGCAVLTGVGAVLNSGDLKMGQSCAIVGLGGVGLAALLGAVATGAATIIAIDIVNDKRALALDLGATHAFNPADDDALASVRALTGGGVDLAVEVAGVVPALDFTYQATRRGGTTVTVGFPHPEARIALSPALLTGEERVLKGSYVGSCVPVRDVPRFARMMQQGKLPIDKLMTHRIGHHQINEAMDRLVLSRAVRQGSRGLDSAKPWRIPAGGLSLQLPKLIDLRNRLRLKPRTIVPRSLTDWVLRNCA